mmetsp:Transcript_11086/g.17495  ORF Transcript_11086/g.17495 Transcript_11086/m.17495 type:complete len:237 (-) Transcript_11086:471-1181(-)
MIFTIASWWTTVMHNMIVQVYIGVVYTNLFLPRISIHSSDLLYPPQCSTLCELIEIAQPPSPTILPPHAVRPVEAVGQRPVLLATEGEVKEHAALLACVLTAAVQNTAVEQGRLACTELGLDRLIDLDKVFFLLLSCIPNQVGRWSVCLWEENSMPHIILNILQCNEERVQRLHCDFWVLGAGQHDGVRVHALPRGAGVRDQRGDLVQPGPVAHQRVQQRPQVARRLFYGFENNWL